MGDSNNDQIILPTVSSGTYNYNVDWGDGNIDSNITTWDDVRNTHTYASAGTYSVVISGTFDGVSVISDKLKLLSIDFWKNINLGSGNACFNGCGNMDINTDSVPLLSGDMSFCFNVCSSLTDPTSSLSNWNVSSVTSMDEMFRLATNFNRDLSSWNVSSVTSMANMFRGATSFNQDISSWNVSSVMHLWLICSETQQISTRRYSTSLATTVLTNSMFQSATNFDQDISGWNVGSVTSMASMFQLASNFDQDLSSWNVNSVTSMANMFNNATSFNSPIFVVTSTTNDITFLFNNASSFNQNTSGWDVSGCVQLP